MAFAASRLAEEVEHELLPYTTSAKQAALLPATMVVYRSAACLGAVAVLVLLLCGSRSPWSRNPSRLKLASAPDELEFDQKTLTRSLITTCIFSITQDDCGVELNATESFHEFAVCEEVGRDEAGKRHYILFEDPEEAASTPLEAIPPDAHIIASLVEVTSWHDPKWPDAPWKLQGVPVWSLRMAKVLDTRFHSSLPRAYLAMPGKVLDAHINFSFSKEFPVETGELPAPKNTLDGVWAYRGRPILSISGITLTTASGKQYLLSGVANSFLLVSGRFGGGSATYTPSRITFANNVVMVRQEVNLDGSWTYNNVQVANISFFTLKTGDKTYRIYGMTQMSDKSGPGFSITGRYGGGSATYNEDTIFWSNGLIFKRAATTTTSTTSRTMPLTVTDPGPQPAKLVECLMIRCQFNDFGPEATEAEVIQTLFAVPGPVDMIERASNGLLKVDRDRSKVVTVQMGTDWAQVSGCPTETIADRALRLVQDQHGIQPSAFTFREFFIPRSPNGGCAWAGLANVGCAHYKLLPRPGFCRAFYQVNSGFVRAHELGHNMGLGHAGGDLNGAWVEYGDMEASMGNSHVFSSYTVPARYFMGVLGDGPGEVLTWNAAKLKRLFKVRSMSLSPDAVPGAEAVGVKVSCTMCVSRVPHHARHTGGHLWVQFRGDQGYSSWRLSSAYQNKVFVHFARETFSLFYGRGTELWAELSEGQAFYSSAAQIAMVACSIRHDLARVAIDVTEEQARMAC